MAKMKMVLDKETKRTYRYQLKDKKRVFSGTIYIPKDYMDDNYDEAPKEFAITVEE